MLRTIIVALLISGLSAVTALGQDAVSKPTLLVGRVSKVRGEQITLGEIGQITSEDGSMNQLVSKLRGIVIADAPSPGGSLQLMGQRIVDAMTAAQIDLGAILFSIPPVVIVQREGRIVTPEEVLATAQQVFSRRNNDGEIKVKQVIWDQDQLVPIGQSSLSVEPLGESSGGKLPLRISVSVDGVPAAKFLATAIVDDWRSIPVLNKTIERGMFISELDVELVRTNVATLSGDVASVPQELVGRAAKTKLSAGESVRKSMIDIPPTITKGARVIARYGSGGLTITAAAVAVDDGFKDREIRVRNESSQKIVRAVVIDDKTVEVR